MSEVGYPTRVVGFHGLFGCKPLVANRYFSLKNVDISRDMSNVFFPERENAQIAKNRAHRNKPDVARYIKNCNQDY